MRALLEVLSARLRRRKRSLAGIVLLAVAAATLAWTLDGGGLHDEERTDFDAGLVAFTERPLVPGRALTWRRAWRGLVAPLQHTPERSRDVVVVALDDKTLKTIAATPRLRQLYGNWPYARTLWPEVNDRLFALGARAVVLDFVFRDPDTENPADDLFFADRLAGAGQPVYLGVDTLEGEAPLPKVAARSRLPAVRPAVPRPAPAAEEDPFAERAPPFALSPEEVAQALAVPVALEGGAALLPMRTGRRGEHVLPPLPELLHGGPGFGLVRPEADPDGKMRRVRLLYTDGQNAYPSLALAAVMDLHGAERAVLSPGRLQLGTHTVHLNAEGDAELPYLGRYRDRFDVVPLVDVLLLDVEKVTPQTRQLFDGRVVVVGGTSLGVGDQKATPYEPLVPGVVKQATEVEALLTDGFIREVPFPVSFAVAVLLAVLSALLVTVAGRTWVEVLWPVALFSGFHLVTGALGAYTRWHLLSVYPALSGTLAALGATALNHLFANRQARLTEDILGRYMEPQLVRLMVEQGKVPTLGGENRELTAFFSDIRGFSSFTERWRDDPQKLVKFLNHYLTRVTAVLFAHQGCVDKYIGDAVVGLFGAPFPDPDHARHACEAALAVKAEVERMREEFRAQGLPDVYTRIGLNSDVMFVGNFGSEQVFDYTAMGDGMNLAARLEGANKAFGTVVMLGENTYRLARDFIEARELDRVRVAGKAQPVAVYELVALKGQLSPAQQQVLDAYAEALAAYRARDVAGARAALDRVLAVSPGDGPALALGERCDKLAQLPPDAPFEAVSNLEK
jgi:adenylate cyclase